MGSNPFITHTSYHFVNGAYSLVVLNKAGTAIAAIVISLILVILSPVLTTGINSINENSIFSVAYAKKGVGSYHQQSNNKQAPANQPSSTTTPQHINHQTGNNNHNKLLTQLTLPVVPVSLAVQSPNSLSKHVSLLEIPSSNITADQPPVIVLNPKSQTISGEFVPGGPDIVASIDANKSYDPGGHIVQYEWYLVCATCITPGIDSTFSVGGPTAESGPTMQVLDLSELQWYVSRDASCRSTDTCKITIQLTVIDNAGLKSTDYAVVHINTRATIGLSLPSPFPRT